MMTDNSNSRSERVMQLAFLFLKLGATAFGGPAAHIGIMEHEIVRRRKWLTHSEFLDLLGATNLIPGPNSTEMAIHVGHRRAGWLGLIVAGTCFILPAMLIVTALAWAYVRYGKLPAAEALLYGVKPVIIAIVVLALWRLGQTAIKTKLLALVGLAAATLNFLGVNELLILFGTAFIMSTLNWFNRKGKGRKLFCLPIWSAASVLPAVSVAAAGAVAPFSMAGMFLFFVKVGAVLFGSGYVLLAFLRADLVERWGWLTESQLLDAIAVGQFTPGPLFTTATFIGYLLAGPWGGVVATIGIFLPAFIYVAISGPLIPRIRNSPAAGAALDGVNVASLALMLVVSWQLGTAALIDWLTVGLAVGALCLLLVYRVNSMWLVLGGAAIGALSAWLGFFQGP